VPVVMDQELFAQSLGFNFEPFGAIRSESDHFPNDTFARNFDGREMTIRTECGS